MDTRARSPLVGSEEGHITDLGVEPMQINTPSGALTQTQLGSSEETCIHKDSESRESDPEPETDPEEEEPLVSEDPKESRPSFRIIFAGGPTIRRTTRTNTGLRYKQTKVKPQTAPISAPPQRFVSARDHPLPAPGTGGWLDE
ncbi:hypothetical protein E2562_029431 [Oryza meyeriana var. granulata]|uniref:Uncharacterized protein n=1 Tax=Oryza meyeriana var. granulata TaxID=110450 RepID=A0A6G1C1B3_9ORYZ|nr:hypothetical protein E2562_029431 [Oryza meyeriana var. granulata]